MTDDRPTGDRATRARGRSSGSGTPANDTSAEQVARTITAWRKHLAALGGPNTLLWFQDHETGSLELTNAHPGGLAMLLAGRETKLSDLIRESEAQSDARRRARAILAKATELHAERGLAVCYLALGMATWKPAGTKRVPAAPVLLRPCSLEPADAGRRDFTVGLGDDLELNPALVHYLRSEEDLEVDAEGLASLALDDGGFNPAPVYEALTGLCSEIPGFTISPRHVVSTFSYSKLPMIADLSIAGTGLAEHRVVGALAGDPDAVVRLASFEDDTPDAKETRAAEESHGLDGDSSQQAAVDAVMAGQDVVIDAPPGTGRAAMIANVVARLAADGKRSLVVSEKRVALDRVRARLEALGLGQLVLDVRDGVGVNRTIIEGLADEVDTRPSVAVSDTTRTDEALAAARKRLTDHVAALHEVRQPWVITAYRAQEEIAALAARPHPPRSHVRITGDALAAIDQPRLRDLGDDLTALADGGAWDPETPDDPWYGAHVTSEADVARATEVCSRLAESGISQVQATFDEVFDELRVPPAHTAADYGEFLSAIEGVRDTLEIFRPEVYDQPLDSLIAATGIPADRVAADISAAEGWRLRRQVRQLLRPGTPPKDLHGALVEAQRQRNDWAAMAGAGGRPQLPVDVDRAHTAYEELHADLTWLGGLLEPTKAGGDLLATPLDDLRTRLASLAERTDRLAVLPAVGPILQRLQATGLGPLVEDLAKRAVEADDVRDELVFLWWTSLAEHVVTTDPRFAGPHGEELRTTARDFADADRAAAGEAAMRIRLAAAERRNAGVKEHKREVEALTRAATTPGTTLSELVAESSDVLFAMRPVWLMSPLVVGGNVPPGEWFDVVVIDQASQVATAEAVSAIARGHQVVVVGDRHQLGPAPYATSVGDEPEEVPAVPSVPSVLDELGALLPHRVLTWDHRYADERLLGFSNAMFYGDGVITFPSTDPGNVVRLETIDGRGVVHEEDGVVETTSTEVGRVVELVAEHVRQRPGESLAVLTITPGQARAVEEAVWQAAWGDDALAEFITPAGTEPFVVTPIDLSQGDLRDAVIVSTGFGRTVHGRVLHRFGPVSAEGGERRVNVAMTRARARLTVVSSFTAEDLDPSRLKGAGPRALRAALVHAETGGRRKEVPTPGSSPLVPSIGLLEQDLAARLRRSGLTVHERVGHGPVPVTLAIEDPMRRGHFLMAIESDGPEYAGVPSLRERDRLRVEALRRRGWEHFRVWTTDLYRDPTREEARILAAVHEATSGDFTAARRDEGSVDEGSVDEGSVDEGPAGGQRKARRSPDQTRDDTDAGWGEFSGGDAHDEWLHEQRPPHWE